MVHCYRQYFRDWRHAGYKPASQIQAITVTYQAGDYALCGKHLRKFDIQASVNGIFCKSMAWINIRKGAIAMFDNLLQWFIQEIPEELSVCEFDSRRPVCMINDWAVCELRYQITADNKGVILHNIFEVKTETAA